MSAHDPMQRYLYDWGRQPAAFNPLRHHLYRWGRGFRASPNIVYLHLSNWGRRELARHESKVAYWGVFFPVRKMVIELRREISNARS